MNIHDSTPTNATGGLLTRVLTFTCLHSSRKFDWVSDSGVAWGSDDDVSYCLDASPSIPLGHCVMVAGHKPFPAHSERGL